MSKKVDQTVTVSHNFALVSTELMYEKLIVLPAKKRKGSGTWTLSNVVPEFVDGDKTLVRYDLAYRAKGANRTDVDRRGQDVFGTTAVIRGEANTVQH